MSGSRNNFTAPPTPPPTPVNWWRGQGYGAHGPSNNDRNRVQPMFPTRPSFGVPPNALEPWFPIEERIMAGGGPLGLASYMAADINPRPRQSIPESPPMFVGQWRNMQVPTVREEESRLTQDEQKKALKQLKREFYYPKISPKTITKRLGLYYRDKSNARNSFGEKGKGLAEDEDSKRCAICLDDFEPTQPVTLTPCSHMFHEECIVPWVKSHGQCPVCRFAMFEQKREHAMPLNNTTAQVPASDLFTRDLISFIRAMEESLEWGNNNHRLTW